MGALETTIIYFVLGLAVGVGASMREAQAARTSFFLGLFFWPLILPTLLATPVRAKHPGGVDQRIGRSERALFDALEQLDGVADELMRPERARIERLISALRRMSSRIAEMDTLLLSPEFSLERAQRTLQSCLERGAGEDDPAIRSIRARLRNIDRLAEMRDKTRADLENALLKIEEIGSQIALLKFAGGAELGLLKLIQDIDASVDGACQGLLDAS